MATVPAGDIFRAEQLEGDDSCSKDNQVDPCSQLCFLSITRSSSTTLTEFRQLGTASAYVCSAAVDTPGVG